MAPLYLGYANPDGTVSSLLLDHYRQMAASGVAMVVVENAAVHPSGLGSPFTVRTDHDRYLAGLYKLARAIQEEGALAVLQINHAGIYRFMPPLMAPSPIPTRDHTPREMTQADIDQMIAAYASAAGRTKEAGFDGVEIHGGTSYLIVQFLSPLSNHRTDRYGGSRENRARFTLEVTGAVIEAVGKNYPVGYRFNADEEMPEGLRVEETAYLARELEKKEVAYLSVMAGSYPAMQRPDYQEKEKQEAYMASYGGEIKKVLAHTPVIVAGRIGSPETADRLIGEGTSDAVGLARVLFADPYWPKKAKGEMVVPIIKCQSACSLCLKKVMKGEPVFCSQWDKETREAFEKRVNSKSFKVGRILRYLRQKYVLKDW